ncbi:hypothetical protein HKD37_09G024053 [Glycine soja]|nr:hypothetical protein GmHk_09G024382 [Glycine max]
MTQPHSTDHNERTWIPPPNGFLKRNLDAAILKEINTFGGGLCIRGEHGSYIKSKSNIFQGISSPSSEAECANPMDPAAGIQ